MNYEVFTTYSNAIGHDMTFSVHGQGGIICLAFAAQDGKYNNFADFGMIGCMEPWINANQVMVVSPDSIDEESWSNTGASGWDRMARQEAFYHYICDELVPLLREKYNNQERMMTTGCSMGGYHAANFALRRPDIFGKCIAMSGFYKSDVFMGDYMDENTFYNSPVHYIGGMPKDHPYIDMYNNSQFVIVSGKGAWEETLLPSNYELNNICQEKGIHVWFDYWGDDVFHDWVWWRKQIVYHMEKMF